MDPKIKRLLSLLLTLALVFSLTAPASAAASTTGASCNTVEIEVGETAKLKASGVFSKTTWATPDADIATVSSNGTVTGVAPGTATITATSKSFFSFFGGGTKTTTYTVIVKEAAVEEPTEPEVGGLTVKAGETLQLEVNANGGTVTWKSSNKNIATVDNNGLVTGVSEGTVTITATVKKTTGGN
ncbi:MAG: Ig-like domain-containing protein, partial [Oscillospiraceae bacterium]|nr:Ig-like domain-containing protein [Oscillospiraceae bacterium]